MPPLLSCRRTPCQLRLARVARGAGPSADQEDFALREWLRGSFEMCMSDRDREVVREAARERIRPVEEAGGEDD